MMHGKLYTHFRGEPCFNMAFDQWLFERGMAEPDGLYLRLYSWQPGAITIGVNQNQETALDMSRVGSTPLIRRITGGRALFHDSAELTYCIAAGNESNLMQTCGGSTVRISRRISEILVEFLSRMGIQAKYLPSRATRAVAADHFQKAPCFASVARHEIYGNYGKIVASAQRRSERAFIQHGSIKLCGLKSHPALYLGSFETAQESDKQQLMWSEFEAAVTRFQKSFEMGLNLPVLSTVPNSIEANEIEVLRESLVQNPLSKKYKNQNQVLNKQHRPQVY